MFLMLPAPPGSTPRTIPYVCGGLNVSPTPAFSSREGTGGGVDAITTLAAWEWRESRPDSTAPNKGRFIRRETKPLKRRSGE
jgi:hypothetical protein